MALTRQEVAPQAAFTPAEANGFHDENPFASEVQAPVAQPVATVSEPVIATVPVVASAGPVPVVASAVAPRQSTGVSIGELADMGFEGLVFDWTAFPMIALKTEGVFEDTEGRNFGKEFNCKITGSKQKFAYRGVALKKDDVIAYSYDKVVTTSGAMLSDVIAGWEAEGREVDEKVYLESLVEIVAPGEETDGELRLISISPTSKGRFSAYIAKLTMRYGKDAVNDQVTKVSVGDKVTNVKNPFYPWSFNRAA